MGRPRRALRPKTGGTGELAKDEPLAKLLSSQIINTALLRAGMLEDPAQLADNSQQLLEKLQEKKA